MKHHILLLSVFLVACASGRKATYQDLLTQFQDAPTPEYYRAEIAKDIPKLEVDEQAEKDAFLTEVEAKVLKVQREFQAQLESETPIPEPFYDFSVPQMKTYRELTTEAEKAEAQLAETVNLELLFAFGYEWNPGIKAARKKLKGTLEQYPQAVYLDNVLRQYNAFTKQLDTKIGQPRHKEMMTMKFPFPDLLALKGQIVTEDVQISQKEIDIELRDLVTDIRLAYYNYLYLNEAIEINRENQELLRQMIQIAQAKFRAGIGKYHSVIMAQVEFSKLSDSIITLEERRETVIARINTLLNRPVDATLGKPQSLAHKEVTQPLGELYTLALKSRQEIQKQKLVISKMNLIIQLATRMTYPDVSLGASYFENRMKLSPTFSTQRTLNLEHSASFGQNDAYIREVKIKTDAMQQKLVELENITRFTVKKHHFGLKTANRSIALYRTTLLPQARSALEAANTAYQAAQVDFISFLDAQRTQLKFRLEEQRALRDHRQHLAQLEQAVGQLLPKQTMEE